MPKTWTRDSIFAVVGIGTFLYAVLGGVPAKYASTVVLVAGGLCGLPVFFGALKK